MTNIHITWQNRADETDYGMVTLPAPISVGRSSRNDLVLNAPRTGVSRRHLQLTMEQNEVVLIDLNSTNGTYLQGRKVDQATLIHGSQFTLGTYVMTINEQVRCANASCQKLVYHTRKMCPWCGQFLADAMTRVQLPAISREIAT